MLKGLNEDNVRILVDSTLERYSEYDLELIRYRLEKNNNIVI